MTLQEKFFLINYLGDRAISWVIDDPVKERYPNLNENIKSLLAEGYVSVCANKYQLTQAGETARAEFRAEERARRNKMHADVLAKAMAADFLGAYNARAAYERNSVIPHGIFVGIGGNSGAVWPQADETPFNVKRSIENSYKLDFSDCKNSLTFKESLRNFYVGISITGSNQIEIPEDFEAKQNEHLICPALDSQLRLKCVFLNPPKLRIYFNTKVTIFNLTSTGTLKEWDKQFYLGVYDCTNRLHFAMAEFEYYSTLQISGFPKTFQTYNKHKASNSAKYRSWMDCVGDRKLVMPSG